MELLPIGSVVRLQGAEKSVMIYGVKQISKADKKLYDYIACPYPEGNINEEFTFMFNHDLIEKIEFFGYINSKFQIYRDELKKQLNESITEENKSL